MYMNGYSIVSFSHYNDVIMSAIASQITNLTIVISTFYSGADQRKHQSFASLAFVRGIHRWPVNYPHKGQWRAKCSIWWRHHVFVVYVFCWLHEKSLLTHLPIHYTCNSFVDIYKPRWLVWPNRWINSLAPHRFERLRYRSRNCPQVIVTGPHWW